MVVVPQPVVRVQRLLVVDLYPERGDRLRIAPVVGLDHFRDVEFDESRFAVGPAKGDLFRKGFVVRPMRGLKPVQVPVGLP
ncbi:MAG: hypothetical protein ACK56I_02940, partial [bacterium]